MSEKAPGYHNLCTVGEASASILCMDKTGDWSTIQAATAADASTTSISGVFGLQATTTTDEWKLFRAIIEMPFWPSGGSTTWGPPSAFDNAFVNIGFSSRDTLTLQELAEDDELCLVGVASTPAWTTADWDILGTTLLSDKTYKISDLIYGSVAAYDELKFPLNATGLSYCDPSTDDSAIFGLRLKSDIDNNEPTWASGDENTVYIVDNGIYNPSQQLMFGWRNDTMPSWSSRTTATVDTDGGGDYLTLAAWEAGEQTTITAPHEVTCTGTTEDTAYCTIQGWGGVTAYRRIVVRGEGGNYPWDSGRYVYRSGRIYCYHYANFVDMQFRMSSSTTSADLVIANANYIQFERCFFRDDSTPSGDADPLFATAYYGVHLYNCTFWSSSTSNGLRHHVESTGSGTHDYQSRMLVCVNCTFVADSFDRSIEALVYGKLALNNCSIDIGSGSGTPTGSGSTNYFLMTGVQTPESSLYGKEMNKVFCISNESVGTSKTFSYTSASTGDFSSSSTTEDRVNHGLSGIDLGFIPGIPWIDEDLEQVDISGKSWGYVGAEWLSPYTIVQADLDIAMEHLIEVQRDLDIDFEHLLEAVKDRNIFTEHLLGIYTEQLHMEHLLEAESDAQLRMEHLLKVYSDADLYYVSALSPIGRSRLHWVDLFEDTRADDTEIGEEVRVAFGEYEDTR